MSVTVRADGVLNVLFFSSSIGVNFSSLAFEWEDTHRACFRAAFVPWRCNYRRIN